MLFGYARASRADQNEDLQTDALAAAGCEKVFVDHGVSGSTDALAREEFARLFEQLRGGDVLVVWRLDRLSRDARSALAVVEALRERGVALRSLTEGLDFAAGPAGQLLLTLLFALAELERAILIERTNAGLDAARARGVRLGRPPVMTTSGRELAARLRGEGQSLTQIARALGVGKSTVHRALGGAS